MPNSRFALHGLAPPQFTVCALFLPLIHGLCAFFRPPLTPVSTAPFLASLSVHGLHFTVYAPSNRSLSGTRNPKMFGRGHEDVRKVWDEWPPFGPFLSCLLFCSSPLEVTKNSGTELAILNRDPGDSESRDSKVALSIGRGCDSDGDSVRDSTLLRFDSCLLLAAEFLAIPGPRFWESCDSQLVICAAKNKKHWPLFACPFLRIMSSTPNPQVCRLCFLNPGQKEKFLLGKPDSPC